MIKKIDKNDLDATMNLEDFTFDRIKKVLAPMREKNADDFDKCFAEIKEQLGGPDPRTQTLETIISPNNNQVKYETNKNHIRMYGHTLCPFCTRCRYVFALKDLPF